MGGSISRFLRDVRFIWRMLSALKPVQQIAQQYDTWNIVSFWNKTCTNYKTNVALQFAGSSSKMNKMTFEELNGMSNRCANAALELGWNSGDVVGLYMSNCIEYVALMIGMAKIGITCSLLNTNIKGESLMHCIKESGVKRLICTFDHVDVIKDLIIQYQTHDDKLKKDDVYVLVRNDESGLTPSYGSTFHFKEFDDEEPSAIHRENVSAMDPFLYIFTSGTTGLPKAAKINHLRFFASSLIFVKLLQLQQKDVLYCPLPFYHSSAIVLGVGISWHTGCTFVFRDKFSTREFWNDCLTYNVTIVQYIGELCRYLLNAQSADIKEKMHCVRMAIGNGLRPDIWERFQSRFQIQQVAEFYAATEGNFGFINTENKVGAVGFLSPLIKKKHPGKIIKYDFETGGPYRDENGWCVPCQAGEVGELVGIIETKDVTRRFDGYTNRYDTEKKMIRNVFRKNDCYFRSGDLLWTDKEGYLYFHDRVGDTYRWKGENVSTTEVEATITTSLKEEVDECVAYGVSVPGCEGKAGMLLIKPAATISTGREGSFDLEHLFSVVKEKLPNYAQPQFIRLCGEEERIGVTGTFKYRKIQLVEEGFNPRNIAAAEVGEEAGRTIRLFFRDKKQFIPLDDTLYKRIISGEVQL
uniref:Very long-chain fatty acid transport protein n=1 Tax=Ditylum brightwellii TaxID=49249 RepID=A0A7S4QSY3_9STRA|mmetsp:Transcript_25366/g.37968  ORF Transcript_25366/g.37968 Transcript_25366/m.37968 type:complete len:638 (+) Transcript_25366:61-1974(+)